MNASASDDRPRRIYNPVQRDAATFLETSEETGGVRTLAELEVAPGGKVTPHYHLTYSERFKVLEGQLTVEIDGIHHELEPGDEAVAESGASTPGVIQARIAASSTSSFGPAARASKTGFASPTGSRPTGSCARTACPATRSTRRSCSRWERYGCPVATPRSNGSSGCWPASPGGAASTATSSAATSDQTEATQLRVLEATAPHRWITRTANGGARLA